MSFSVLLSEDAEDTLGELKAAAERSIQARQTGKRKKATRAEGLFKQVAKCIALIAENPRHPGLQTHQFLSVPHPYKADGKVFEAYAQNRTPGAFRVFWCYGPERDQITIIAITPHP